MAAAAARHSKGGIRSGRFRMRHESGEDTVKLDPSKDLKENVKEVLIKSVVVSVTKVKKLAYLNAFVKLLNRIGKDKDFGFSKLEILSCLRISLFHGAKEVRAATLRVLRYFLQDEETLDLIFNLHIDYLIARSIDVCLDNEVERIHAIKLVRKIAQLAPHKLTCSMIYPLVSIGNDGVNERDRMVRVSLATLCEIAFVNPALLAYCGGISTLIRAVLDCHQFPRMNESLVFTILHLINHPRSRHYIRINSDLEELLAPFTDYHYRYSAEMSEVSIKEDREHRFAASKMAIVSIMRSWPGIIRFCRPDGTGLQSLIGILYLPYTEIREGIIEILFDIFRLRTPVETEDIGLALLSVDPSEMRENWHLTDGFVAEEGREILPHMAKIRPNLVENHLALLLSAWIGAGLLSALVEVIISSELTMFIKTTILLGKLLHLASTLMPNECSQHNYCLPTLIALASSPDASSRQRHKAREAVYYLDRLHTLRKRGLVPCSLFLDQLIQRTSGRKVTHTKAFHINKDKLQDIYLVKNPHEDLVNQAIKDSQVLNTKDSINWDWDLIGAILKFSDDKIRKLDDQGHLRFIKRLIFFYKPTNHLFSRLEMTNEHSEKIAYIGCQLVDFLVESDQDEASKIILDFLNDIGQCLSEIALQHVVPESVLSPSNIINTCSRYYFLFVGRFSATARGDRYLEKTGIFQYLLEIVGVSPQDSYIKVIVSSLNYSREGNTRPILGRALVGSTESSRLYCTNFMRVLLRIGVPGFHSWGMELLTTQLYDQSRAVAMSALNVLEEACDVESCLKSLVHLRPTCLHLGEKGVLMVCRFVSTSKGFKSLKESNYLTNELQKWYKSYNTKYVLIVEELLDEALTTYEKTYEGSYTRRSSQRRPKKDAYVPVHLYGQLTQHKEGFQLLRQQHYIEEYFQCIRSQDLHHDSDILNLKAALWAVGHIGTSTSGVCWLEEEKMLPEIVRLAEECGVFSVRGTAFYVLGLIASTREGAEMLTQLGWESCWNTREESWPVIEDRTMLLADKDDNISESNFSVFSGGSAKSEGDQRSYQSPGVMSSSLFFIQEEGKTPSKGCDTELLVCDNNNLIKTSPVNIPRKSRFIGRSKTLPVDSMMGNRKNLPIRSYAGKAFTPPSNYEKSLSIEEESDTDIHVGKTHIVKQKSASFDETIFVHPADRSLETSKIREGTSDVMSIPVIRFIDSDDKDSDQEKISSSDLSKPGAIISCEDNKENEDEEEDEGGINFSSHLDKSHDKSHDKSESFDNKMFSQDEAHSKTDSLDSKTPKVIEQLLKKSPNLKEGRSSSSDSSGTSKNRADSFNTDSTTSGISSCESGPTTCFSSDVISLSPIASSTTIETVGLSQYQPNLETRDFIHPSTVVRRSLNLSRIPSVRQQQTNSTYGMLSSAKLMESQLAESAIIYTTNRDSIGYATWRSIRRQRAISSDAESDLGIDHLFDDENVGFRSRRSSIDSKMSVEVLNTFRLSGGLPRNSSAVSLPDQDSRPSSPYTTTTKTILHCHKPHTGAAEFLGLTLPVDINMLFQVHEGEDRRSSTSVKPHRSRAHSHQESEYARKGSEEMSRLGDHEESVCIQCHKLQSKGSVGGAGATSIEQEDDIPDIDAESDFSPAGVVMSGEGDAASLLAAYRQQQKIDKAGRLRLDSVNEPSSATPGSMSSCASNESPSNRLTLDTDFGRNLFRKEIKRFVINLSSSVGVKGSEQGLLRLKQKFPHAFQNVCFYSDVSYLLCLCSFRLTARRFIQELFDDFDISVILQEVYLWLGITEPLEPKTVVPTKQIEGLDSLWENQF